MIEFLMSRLSIILSGEFSLHALACFVSTTITVDISSHRIDYSRSRVFLKISCTVGFSFTPLKHPKRVLIYSFTEKVPY